MQKRAKSLDRLHSIKRRALSSGISLERRSTFRHPLPHFVQQSPLSVCRYKRLGPNCPPKWTTGTTTRRIGQWEGTPRLWAFAYSPPWNPKPGTQEVASHLLRFPSARNLCHFRSLIKGYARWNINATGCSGTTPSHDFLKRLPACLPCSLPAWPHWFLRPCWIMAFTFSRSLPARNSPNV